MLLQNKLDAFKTQFETKAPAEALAVLHRATQDLIASGQAECALKAGDSAPSFELPDENGALISLADLTANGPLVVVFYRGAWCPFCNIDLEAIDAVTPAICDHGASIVAISPQTSGHSRKLKSDKGLSFPLLSDLGNEVAKRFGIAFRLPVDVVGIHEAFGIDLASFNGESSWTLPMPARFIIDPAGTIAYAEVNPDYTRRPDPEELLPVLRRLGASVAL